MNNKPNSGTITPEKRKGMPSRGKNKKTLILEAIKESAAFTLPENASNEDVEKAMFAHMAESAFCPVSEIQKDQSSLCMNLLMKKGWPDLKPQSAPVSFEFTPGEGPSRQAEQILNAVAAGDLSVEQGATLVSAIGTMMKIKEADEFEQRLKAIEESVNAGKAS